MAVGTVKWFNDAKGFGFIEPDGGGADVFAHFSAVQMQGFRTLKQGGRVSFDVVQGPKGQLAQNIAPLEEVVPLTAPVAHLGWLSRCARLLNPPPDRSVRCSAWRVVLVVDDPV